MSPSELAAAVGERYADVVVAHDEVTVVVEREALLEALAWLRRRPGIELDLLSSRDGDPLAGARAARSGSPTNFARATGITALG